MKNCVLFFLCICVICSSCSKDDDAKQHGNLEIIFKARYDNQPLVYGHEYDYFGSGKILFGTAEFYLSNISMSHSSGFVEIKDVDYISLLVHHTTIEKAEEGLKVVYKNIPVGDYSALNMNIGLTSDQNQTKPEDYLATHPLGDGSRYWAGWNSYIFTKTEGTFKSSANYNFTYHSGFDETLRTLEFNREIHVKNGETTTIEISIDYKILFDLGGTGLNIPANPQIHNTSVIMSEFIDRFQYAMTIK
jgi:hypothetical protein